MTTIDRFNNTTLSSTNRSYIAVAAFNLDFFSYTVTTDNQGRTTGSLGAVSGATSGNCPKGRILRENGRKLYPQANPGINVYMVGVYDPVTGFKGFIDPNSPVFAPFNTDKPCYLADSTDPGPGALADKGAPVYTNSSVQAGTYITAGTTITAGSNIVANSGQVRVNKVTTISPAVVTPAVNTIDPNSSQVFDIQLPNNSSTVLFEPTGLSTAVGAVVYLIITNNYTNTRNIDFNNTFLTQNVGVFTLAANSINTFTFVCNGANLFQVAQAITLSP